MLPSLDGLEVCRQLRRAAPVPVIMLTARDEEGDRIAGLESVLTTTWRSRSPRESSQPG